MNPKLVLTPVLALLGLASAAQQHYEMRSYVRVGGRTQAAFAWCDAPQGVVAVTQPRARSQSARALPVTLMRWNKTAAGLRSSPAQDYLLGPADAGAGNVYTALTPPGRIPPEAGSGPYYVHSSNVENVLDPAYRLTHVNGFRLPEGDFTCRYVPGAAFLGVTARRAVVVWESGSQVSYVTRNFDGTSGVLLRGGKLDGRSGAGEGKSATFTHLYSWNTPGGYRYGLAVSNRGGLLSVQRGGRTLQTEPLLAYSVSLPAGDRP